MNKLKRIYFQRPNPKMHAFQRQLGAKVGLGTLGSSQEYFTLVPTTCDSPLNPTSLQKCGPIASSTRPCTLPTPIPWAPHSCLYMTFPSFPHAWIPQKAAYFRRVGETKASFSNKLGGPVQGTNFVKIDALPVWISGRWGKLARQPTIKTSSIFWVQHK